MQGKRKYDKIMDEYLIKRKQPANHNTPMYFTIFDQIQTFFIPDIAHLICMYSYNPNRPKDYRYLCFTTKNDGFKQLDLHGKVSQRPFTRRVRYLDDDHMEDIWDYTSDFPDHVLEWLDYLDTI